VIPLPTFLIHQVIKNTRMILILMGLEDGLIFFINP
jgi:hypothetical protein